MSQQQTHSTANPNARDLEKQQNAYDTKESFGSSEKERSTATNDKKIDLGVKPEDEKLLTIVLIIFIPWLAVLWHKGIDQQFIITLILSCLFWLPGVLYAYFVVFKDDFK
ncbi:uncharacterized protein LODBEIA_P32740 [Lodderomyces beijingensis]|uniref:YqaE/Pmp3 family membrane protein n=1 Tax=Lodderomyces beijingensis TaxID=1775926 RepID=A0ABP0ZPA8_9ASCO